MPSIRQLSCGVTRKWCKVVPMDQKKYKKKGQKNKKNKFCDVVYTSEFAFICVCFVNETHTHVPIEAGRPSYVWRTEMWMLWPCDHGNESVSTRGRDSPTLKYQSSVLISVILNSQCSPPQQYKRHAHSSDAIFDPRRHQCDSRSCLTAKHFPSLKAVRRNVTLKLDWRN